MSLVIYELVDDSQLLPGERMGVAHMQQPPSKGDRVSLGTHRLWDVVAVDSYQSSTEGDKTLYLAHCCRGTVPPRSDWFLVRELQHYPSELRVYLLNGELEHWGVSLDGTPPKAGVRLPQFNIAEHTVTPRNVGVESLGQYSPQKGLEHPCYRSIWVGHCVAISEPLRTTSEALQVA